MMLLKKVVYGAEKKSTPFTLKQQLAWQELPEANLGLNSLPVNFVYRIKDRPSCSSLRPMRLYECQGD